MSLSLLRGRPCLTHIQSSLRGHSFSIAPAFSVCDQWERHAVEGAWWLCDFVLHRAENSSCQVVRTVSDRRPPHGALSEGPQQILKLEVWDSASETPILARELPSSPALRLPCEYPQIVWGSAHECCRENQMSPSFFREVRNAGSGVRREHLPGSCRDGGR